jgi:hypothetical protein
MAEGAVVKMEWTQPERPKVTQQGGHNNELWRYAGQRDVVETPCPCRLPDVPVPCEDGRLYSGVEHMGHYESWPCPTCDGTGKVQVRLTEDPIREAFNVIYDRWESPPPAFPDGLIDQTRWKIVGEIQS